MVTDIKYNRAEHMAGMCNHREFYAQFVGEPVIYLVSTGIGHAAIKASTDPHFNDIPLVKWDNLTRFNEYRFAALNAANGGGGISLSDKVCILKEAARQYKESLDAIP